MDEFSLFNCDVLGLSETKRHCDERFTWKDGGQEVLLGKKVEGKNIGGVGFIVGKKWANKIDEMQVYSPRLAKLTLSLSPNRKLSIIQVYAPTSDYEEEEIEEFYDSVEEILSTCTNGPKVVIGDFNARIGIKEDNEKYIGTHAYGERNESGQRMAAFCESNKLFVGNSFFQKKLSNRWTWLSPNSTTKAEIDFVLCSCRQMLRDVAVVTPFKTLSDHRLLRAKITIGERLLHVARNRKVRRKVTTDQKSLKEVTEQTDWQYDEDPTTDFELFQRQLEECQKAATRPLENHQEQRISSETRKLFEERQHLKKDPSNSVQLAVLSKLCRQKLQEDLQLYKDRKLKDAVDNRRSIKKAKQNLNQKRLVMNALKAADGQRKTTKWGIEHIIKDYYTSLFESKCIVDPPMLSPNDVPEVLPDEVKLALKAAKNGKANGPDNISTETIKACPVLCDVLARKFTIYLRKHKIPDQWRSSDSILLHKKGDKEQLKNYRPICLLSVIYKLFTKVLLNRIQSTLDSALSKEQAGFRKGYSTMDHIHTLKQLIEKCREYQMPLVLVFIDYEKAFDSAEINAILNAIEKQGVDHGYIATIQDIYKDCSTNITIFDEPIKIPINRGVRQGDTISPKLFTAALEEVFNKMGWEDKGILIDGERLNHLKFADDIVLVTSSTQQAESMLIELEAESRKIGLKMNMDKTKVMKNVHVTDAGAIVFDNTTLEEVDSYVYLGQLLKMDSKLDGEISRRRRAAWMSFNSVKDAIESTSDLAKKRTIYETTVLPSMLYGSETWSTTKTDEAKFGVTQRAIERRILNISLRDKVPNEELRQIMKTGSAEKLIWKRKRQWAGHIARRTDDRWTAKTTNWLTYKGSWKALGFSRPVGRPKTRWLDSIKEACVPYQMPWSRLAQNRTIWKTLEPAEKQKK